MCVSVCSISKAIAGLGSKKEVCWLEDTLQSEILRIRNFSNYVGNVTSSTICG